MNTPATPSTATSPRIGRPTKHFSLVLWRLLYHVELHKVLDRQDEIDACRHARMPVERWDDEKARFSRQWDKLLAKRQRRLTWHQAHGSVADGWTPVDPKDPRRTANKPVAAYLARRKATAEQIFTRHSRMIRRQPNWTAIRRLMAWEAQK